MAYTIKVFSNDSTDARTLTEYVEGAVNGSRFTATFSAPQHEYPTRKRDEGFLIIVRPVRLKEAKEYCGQHPGECFVPIFGGPRKKMRSRCLEWNDWVAFHGIINDVIDRHGFRCDVWSTPMESLDHGKKFWIRRDNVRRVRWDYEEQYRGIGVPLRIWNTGSPDQFTAERE